MEKQKAKKTVIIIIKAILGSLILLVSPYVALVSFMFSVMSIKAYELILSIPAIFFLPSLLPFLFFEKKKKYFIVWGSCLLAIAVAFSITFGIEKYNESITINVTPNIDVNEYLPFDEDSKIVKFRSETFTLTEDPPIIDGATAAFPVYSAFVNAVYPETTELFDGVFEYNNTVGGYRKLAEKEIDIFLGAQPSKEQVQYATECGTTFRYTEIGTEAFVFFVHKDNPISTLTTEQIKGIYSGEITNWSEVGGNDEKIMAFQRNKNSGSQSMMIRFMGETPLMTPEMKEEVSGMGEIIQSVVDYKSKSGSIGFSFRYYIEGIIKNPDIKLIAVDGVSPTVENIKNKTYPIVTPVYAVTYEGNTNPNVALMLDWILSDEGQYIIEKTGYIGVRKR